MNGTDAKAGQHPDAVEVVKLYAGSEDEVREALAAAEPAEVEAAMADLRGPAGRPAPEGAR